MDKATYEKYAKRHWELWNWLSHHQSKGKSQWPGWERNGGRWPSVEVNCFACEVSEKANCGDCPIIWGKRTFSGQMRCGHDDSPYSKWSLAKSLKTHKKYAALIRDAVWIPYEEWKEL